MAQFIRASNRLIFFVAAILTCLVIVENTNAQGYNQTISSSGDAAPDGDGTHTGYGSTTRIKDSGQIAFHGGLTGTIGGGADSYGIFRGTDLSVDQILRHGQAAPDTNGVYWLVTSPLINNSGQVAVWSFLEGTSGGNADNRGIFYGNGGPVSQLVRSGQAVPNTNDAVFQSFYDFSFNDLNQAAFRATISENSAYYSALLRGANGSFTTIAQRGQSAPGGGTFSSSSFASTTINNSGQVAFFGELEGTSGGAADNHGIFRGSGGSLT